MATNPDNYTYYLEHTPIVLIRKGTIAFLVSVFTVYSISGWLQIFDLIIASDKEWLKDIKELFKALPEPVNKFPWGLNAHLVLIFSLWLPVFKSRQLRAVDFFLFSSCNRDLFNRIDLYTGLFKWVGPCNESQKAVWNEIKGWTYSNLGDGRWNFSWCYGQPQIERTNAVDSGKNASAFEWNILLGATGSGKTQLAKEFARSLSNYTGNTNWRRKLAAWWNKILPWSIRQEHEPWDCGILAEAGEVTPAEKLQELKLWRPSAPTFILLDDPAHWFVGEVINILSSNQKRFWYPVRLLIVDQFISPSIPIDSDTYGPEWHIRNTPNKKHNPFVLESSPITLNQFRRLLSGGVWYENQGQWQLQIDLPVLYRDSDKTELLTAVEGNVLLLSFAALWAANNPNKPISNLLSQNSLTAEEEELFHKSNRSIKTLVSHRLINERLERLYESYKSLENNQNFQFGELCNAVACATLANGLNIQEAQQFFGVKISQSDWRRVFPDGKSGAVSYIPPISPWQIGGSFVAKQHRQLNYSDKWQSMISIAMQKNLWSTFKNLSRYPAPLTVNFEEIIKQLPKPDNKREQLHRVSALIELLLFGFHQESQNTKDKLLTLVISILDELDTSNIFLAIEYLSKMCKSRRPQIPLATARLIIFASLIRNAFKLGKIQPKIIFAFMRHLEDLGLTIPKVKQLQTLQSEYIHNQIVSTLKSIAIDLLFNINRFIQHPDYPLLINQFNNTFSQKDPEWTAFGLYAYASFTSKSINSTILYAGSLSLKLLYSATELDVEEAEKIAFDLEEAAKSQLIRPHSSSFSCFAKSMLLYAYCFAGKDPNGLFESIEIIAKANPENEYIQSIKASTLRYILQARASDPLMKNQLQEGTLEVSKIAKLFNKNNGIQLEMARCWNNMLWVNCNYPTSRKNNESLLSKVINIADQFPDCERIQNEKAIALVNICWDVTQSDGLLSKVELAALEVKKIADLFPHNEDIQESQASAWYYAACHNKENPTNAKAAASEVEKIANLFPHNDVIQLQKAKWWCHAAFARGQVPSLRGKVNEALLEVIKVAEQFPEVEDIQEQKALAWRYVSWAKCQNLSGRADIEAAVLEVDKAVLEVDKVAEQFPESEGIHEQKATVWRYLTMTLSGNPKTLERAELALLEVINVAGQYIKNEMIQEEKANAWCHIAIAKCKDSLELANPALLEVNKVADEFPKNERIQLLKAIAWRSVSGTGCKESVQRDQTEVAALEVVKVAEMFPHHEAIQEEKAFALRNLTQVRSYEPVDRLKAEAAASEVFSVAKAYPQNSNIQKHKQDVLNILSRNIYSI